MLHYGVMAVIFFRRLEQRRIIKEAVADVEKGREDYFLKYILQWQLKRAL